MKIKTASGIDYISFSTAYSVTPDEMLPMHPAFAMRRLGKPFRFYSVVWELASGATMAFSPGNEKQGCLFTASGEAMTNIRKMGFSDQRMINFIAEEGHKPTRIDFAIDVFDAGKVSHIERMYNAGKLLIGQRQLTKYSQLGTERGQTIYIGSLKSDACVRIYDKGHEQGTGERWIRIEAQLRRENALAAMYDMNEQGVETAGKAHIKKIIEAPTLAWFSRAIASQGSASIVSKSRGDFWRWLKDTVKPAILNHIGKERGLEREKIREWLLQVLQEPERESKIPF